jgi:hypothetical protein
MAIACARANWVCFAAALTRMHVPSVCDVSKRHQHLHLQPQTTRRTRPAAGAVPLKVKWVRFEALVRSASLPEAFGVSISNPRNPQRLSTTNWVCFAKRSSGAPHASGVSRSSLLSLIRLERETLRFGGGDHASSMRYTDQAYDSLVARRTDLADIARDRAALLMRAARSICGTCANKYTHEPKIGYCPARPPW